jgi:hypothetical protein
VSHESVLTTLDLDDLTPRQLRKILNGVARSQLPYAKKSEDEKKEQADEDGKKVDSMADLLTEKKGDSKPPKVLATDLPASDKDDDEDEDSKDTKKKKA